MLRFWHVLFEAGLLEGYLNNHYDETHDRESPSRAVKGLIGLDASHMPWYVERDLDDVASVNDLNTSNHEEIVDALEYAREGLLEWKENLGK